MPLSKRALEWGEQYRNGMTLQEIAETNGVSRQRVHQVIRPLNIPPRPPVEVKPPGKRRAEKIWSVYVMAAPSSSSCTYFKVGISSDIFKRLCQVQTGCPLPISTMWAITTFNNGAAQDLEKKLHALLWAYRTQGEWFAMDTKNPEHKATMNEAFAFAVKACSVMAAEKWRRLSVSDALNSARLASKERAERAPPHPDSLWGKHLKTLDNWPI